MLKKTIQQALKRMYDDAGTQKELEKRTGVSQGMITGYLSGKRNLENMQISTLAKLFPELKMSFFGDEVLQGDEYEKFLVESFRKLTVNDRLEVINYIKGRLKPTNSVGRLKNSA